jgi:hypothetical protein
MVVDNNRRIAGNFDFHADAAVGCGAHCPMEHIGQVPALYCPGGCHGQRIRMKHTKTNKTQLLASNYGTF